MTKYEKKIKSMLSYYQIDMTGGKDEKMSKKDQKKFLDTLNTNYDTHTVQDMLSKIKDKLKDSRKEEDEESDDPFFDSLRDKNEDKDDLFPQDLNSLSNKKFDKNKLPFGMNPEIEMFINWLSDLLYSADHKVIVRESDDGQTTNIELQKIKKKGGRKK